MTIPNLDQLIARLKAIKPSPLDQIGFRSVTPRYAKQDDILSGIGSRLHGGRWNPTGIATVYASFTPATAMAESLAHFEYYGFPAHAAMPRLFIALEARLSRVLDLTIGENRRRLRISDQRLLKCDWRREMAAGTDVLTQLVGRAAWEAGFEGMTVRSAADTDGRNFVVFPEHLKPSSRLVLRNADQLAR